MIQSDGGKCSSCLDGDKDGSKKHKAIGTKILDGPSNLLHKTYYNISLHF